MLYKYYLSDAEAINSSFIVAELDLLNTIIKKHTGRILFKANDNKTIKVDKISKVIGDKTIVDIVKQKQTEIKTLKDISYEIINSGSVPKAVLATSVACIKCYLQINEWIEKSTLPMEIQIQHFNETFQLFCHPECSEKHQQIEPRTVDPTHMLTN